MIYQVLFNIIAIGTFSLIFGRFFSQKWIGISSFILHVSCVAWCLLIFFFLIEYQCSYYYELFYWIKFFDFFVSYNFIIDYLSIIMFLIILFVSFCVQCFSIGYMDNDPHQVRFFGYLSFFSFFMMLLVCSYNFLQIFLGWEGVGIVSYLLINFWFSRIEANKSAMMALLTNKIGDVAFILSMMFFFSVYGSLDLSVIFAQQNCIHFQNFNSFFGCIFLSIAALVKSSQIPFHFWLPEAMEGPTPVSALLHAATMVTAGVFLLVRCSFLFDNQFEILMWISFIGGITSLLGSITAFFQNDLKKIVAYSTTSQLGYMFVSCGFFGFDACIYHLMNHAAFKALLFLSAGSIIHLLLHEQDIRHMGGLFFISPLGYISSFIGSMSLMGFPFLSGFFSKESILSAILSEYSNSFFFTCLILFFPFISIIFTVLYNVRLLYHVFFSMFKGSFSFLEKFQVLSFWKRVPLFFLSILSICLGWYSFSFFLSAGTDWFQGSICVCTLNILRNFSFDFVFINSQFFSFLKDLPVFWVFYFFILYLTFMDIFFFRMNFILFFFVWLRGILYFICWRFLFEKFLYPLVNFLVFRFSGKIFSFLEKGMLEGFILSSMSDQLNSLSRVMFTYKLHHYFGFVIMFFVFIMHELSYVDPDFFTDGFTYGFFHFFFWKGSDLKKKSRELMTRSNGMNNRNTNMRFLFSRFFNFCKRIFRALFSPISCVFSSLRNFFQSCSLKLVGFLKKNISEETREYFYRKKTNIESFFFFYTPFLIQFFMLFYMFSIIFLFYFCEYVHEPVVISSKTNGENQETTSVYSIEGDNTDVSNYNSDLECFRMILKDENPLIGIEELKIGPPPTGPHIKGSTLPPSDYLLEEDDSYHTDVFIEEPEGKDPDPNQVTVVGKLNIPDQFYGMNLVRELKELNPINSKELVIQDARKWAHLYEPISQECKFLGKGELFTNEKSRCYEQHLFIKAPDVPYFLAYDSLAEKEWRDNSMNSKGMGPWFYSFENEAQVRVIDLYENENDQYPYACIQVRGDGSLNRPIMLHTHYPEGTIFDSCWECISKNRDISTITNTIVIGNSECRFYYLNPNLIPEHEKSHVEFYEGGNGVFKGKRPKLENNVNMWNLFLGATTMTVLYILIQK